MRRHTDWLTSASNSGTPKWQSSRTHWSSLTSVSTELERYFIGLLVRKSSPSTSSASDAFSSSAKLPIPDSAATNQLVSVMVIGRQTCDRKAVGSTLDRVAIKWLLQTGKSSQQQIHTGRSIVGLAFHSLLVRSQFGLYLFLEQLAVGLCLCHVTTGR